MTFHLTAKFFVSFIGLKKSPILAAPAYAHNYIHISNKSAITKIGTN